MNENRYDRRKVIKGALAGLAALPAAGLIREAAAQGEMVKIEESDPPWKNPMLKEGANCANCLQIAGKEGEEWRPCNIFPGKLVHSNGWCKVWVAKP